MVEVPYIILAPTIVTMSGGENHPFIVIKYEK